MSQWLEESVQGFFSQLNWDNRARVSSHSLLPMAYRSVASFMESIPWNGDPVQLSAQSLQQATAETWAPIPEEDLPFTLSDLSGLF